MTRSKAVRRGVVVALLAGVLAGVGDPAAADEGMAGTDLAPGFYGGAGSHAAPGTTSAFDDGNDDGVVGSGFGGL